MAGNRAQASQHRDRRKEYRETLYFCRLVNSLFLLPYISSATDFNWLIVRPDFLRKKKPTSTEVLLVPTSQASG